MLCVLTTIVLLVGVSLSNWGQNTPGSSVLTWEVVSLKTQGETETAPLKRGTCNATPAESFQATAMAL